MLLPRSSVDDFRKRNGEATGRRPVAGGSWCERTRGGRGNRLRRRRVSLRLVVPRAQVASSSSSRHSCVLPCVLVTTPLSCHRLTCVTPNEYYTSGVPPPHLACSYERGGGEWHHFWIYTVIVCFDIFTLVHFQGGEFNLNGVSFFEKKFQVIAVTRFYFWIRQRVENKLHFYGTHIRNIIKL